MLRCGLSLKLSRRTCVRVLTLPRDIVPAKVFDPVPCKRANTFGGITGVVYRKSMQYAEPPEGVDNWGGSLIFMT